MIELMGTTVILVFAFICAFAFGATLMASMRTEQSVGSPFIAFIATILSGALGTFFLWTGATQLKIYSIRIEVSFGIWILLALCALLGVALEKNKKPKIPA